MHRYLLIASFAINSLFCQQAMAVSAIRIHVGAIDAPIGQLKNAQFQVDLKSAQPTLRLHAEVKPTNEKEFVPFDLKCDQFSTEKVGQTNCLNGNFISQHIKAPFSIYFISGKSDFSIDILFKDANFSDEAGLHAGEKLTGQVKLAAKNINDAWQWNGLISWTEGELFWQPFYFGKAGNSLAINGTFKQPMLNIENASLLVNEVGKMTAKGQVNLKTNAVEDIKVSANDVDFAGLYAIFLKPMAEKSAFGNLEVSGKADWQFEIKNLSPTSFEL
ncbi:MAG: hypothetical protein ABIU85_10710, partial [Methylotenera sp.]